MTCKTMEAPQISAEQVELSDSHGKLLFSSDATGEEPTPDG